MPKEPPTVKLSELSGDTRKLLLTMVRMVVEKCPQAVQHMGFDCAEETLLKLLETGDLKFVTDDEFFWLKVYDPIQDQYINLTEVPE